MDADTRQSPIKVAFVTPKVYPLFNPAVEAVFGGAEVDVYFLATELAKDREFEVSCVVADYGQPAVESREGVGLIKSLDFDENSLRGARKIWQALRRVDADIYFVKTASAGVVLLAWFCRCHNKRFVYRLASQRESNGLYLKNHPIVGRTFYGSLRRAAVVLTQNQDDVACLKAHFDIDGEMIPNGHRLPSFKRQDRRSILWVGRSDTIKQAGKFLSLARTFPEKSFVMICQCATGDRNYGDLVAEAEKRGNLRFLKRVAFREIDDYFQQAQVLVNTSDAEGFPNTFIQAARCGTPILSLNVNPDNFLHRHQCGLCADGDERRFHGMLKDLLNPKTAHHYGQNGRKYAHQNHDIQRIVQRYAKIFNKILSRRA